MVLFSSATSQPVATTHYIDLAATPFPEATPPEIHAPAAPAIATSTTQEQPKEEIPKEEMPVTVPAAPATVSPEVLSTPLGLGMAHGFFKSLAEGRTLRDEIRVYYFEILEKINTSWWQKAGTLKESVHQDGIIDISIGPDGVLQEARLVSTTGSAEVDRAIIEILKEASPFTPPPVSFGQDSFRAPLRIAAPSNLFRLGGK
ncbi:TonB C-terminal domain-containing protein [Pelotalea chapellei]|uniref:Energy transducer TonB n=1 Tax=Pelotalea chapellei TaxID=44671 RepID=A0ABS5UCV4_9BACT|nr:TonB C-terminal domain-containing protein [Pelotalea chapellei]MBT1073549.1 energy transducer TonB [Pelotalea chapellei]